MLDYANFLSQLNNDQQHQLTNLAIAREFVDDEMIGALGSNNDDVYILVKGRVKICELTADGKEVILWFCSDGELIGFAEALVSLKFSSHQVNAQACGHGELMVIKRSDFVNFMSDNPAVVMPVVQTLGFRLREVSEVLMDITSSDVTSRVVKLLSRLGGLYGKSVDGGVHIDIPITHQEMADMIGTSRQSVTTILGELKRQGMIRVEQRMIFIRNKELLHSSSESRIKPSNYVSDKSPEKNADVEH
ncbi:Crp/Fnr family transcriptional regulator [Kaarinaea lacus]